MRRDLDVRVQAPAQVRELVRTAFPSAPEAKLGAVVSVASELAAVAVDVCEGTMSAEAHDRDGKLHVTLEGRTTLGSLPPVDRYRLMVIEGLTERWDAELGPSGRVRFDAVVPGELGL